MSWGELPRARRQRGASAVEYAIMVVFLSASVIVGVTSFKSLGGKYRCKVAKATGLFGSLTGDGKGGEVSCDDGSGALASNDPAPGAGGSGQAGPTPGITCLGTSCSPGSNRCFVAGTLVLTESGPQPIESLVVGMRVWARAEDGDALGWKRIDRTFASTSVSLVQLTIGNGDGQDERVEVTPSHLLYVAGSGWVEARTLDPDRDVLVDASGAPLTIRAVATVAEHVPVFNLEVADFHTYFVGAHGLWAHNGYAPGQVMPITLPDGSPGWGLVVSRDRRAGTYDVEYSDGRGNQSSFIVRNNGRVVSTHPLPGPTPYVFPNDIAGLPVTNAPPLAGPTRVGSQIYIDSPTLPPGTLPIAGGDFRQNTLNNLNTIAQTQAGVTLLQGLDHGGHPVHYQYTSGLPGQGAQATAHQGGANNIGRAAGTYLGTQGAGTGSNVLVNPMMYGQPRSSGRGGTVENEAAYDSYRGNGAGRSYNKPPDVTTYHESAHAYANQRGINDDWYLHGQPSVYTGGPAVPAIREQQAVGIGDFGNAEISENAYREQRGLPPRQWYDRPNEVYPDAAERGYDPNTQPFFSPPPRLPPPPPPLQFPPGWCN